MSPPNKRAGARRPASAPDRIIKPDDDSLGFEELLAELQALRAREKLLERYLVETTAEVERANNALVSLQQQHNEAHALLKLATWVVQGAVTHGERMNNGKWYRIPGVVYDSLAGLVGYGDDGGEG